MSVSIQNTLFNKLFDQRVLDPEVEVRPVMGQIVTWSGNNEAIGRDERVFITTLTKRMAEDLTDYLKDLGIKVAYLHADIKTREYGNYRDLRLGKYDVLVVLTYCVRIDVPEVSLVAILDADKEGFCVIHVH